MKPVSTQSEVKNRYAAAAKTREQSLCCPVEYSSRYLEAIPAEVIEKDYGCGDPSQYLQPGETVLDLGSGTGKICFIASQVVGPKGKVIGIDMTNDMLEVARRNAPIVARNIGFQNVEFRKGRIQDLALDLEELDRLLGEHPIRTSDDFLAAGETAQALRKSKPLVAPRSIDVVVSNCVLNLVEAHAKTQLFQELHRVLKNGGRAVISDIVSDEDVPAALQENEELWSGCISGAFREDKFLQAFEQAGFYGMRILQRDPQPWRVVEGIEFRSLTVEAFKGKEGPSLERLQCAIYKGPFKSVTDDDHHTFERGARTAVCDKTFRILKKAPYREHFELLEPTVDLPLDAAKPFDGGRSPVRDPREIKRNGLTTNFSASMEPRPKCC